MQSQHLRIKRNKRRYKTILNGIRRSPMFNIHKIHHGKFPRQDKKGEIVKFVSIKKVTGEKDLNTLHDKMNQRNYDINVGSVTKKSLLNSTYGLNEIIRTIGNKKSDFISSLRPRMHNHGKQSTNSKSMKKDAIQSEPLNLNKDKLERSISPDNTTLTAANTTNLNLNDTGKM